MNDSLRFTVSNPNCDCAASAELTIGDGFGCTICIDVGRKAMQMYTSGADVYSIRAAIEKEYAPNAEGRTPTPAPPAKKAS